MIKSKNHKKKKIKINKITKMDKTKDQQKKRLQNKGV